MSALSHRQRPHPPSSLFSSPHPSFFSFFLLLLVLLLLFLIILLILLLTLLLILPLRLILLCCLPPSLSSSFCFTLSSSPPLRGSAQASSLPVGKYIFTAVYKEKRESLASIPDERKEVRHGLLLVHCSIRHVLLSYIVLSSVAFLFVLTIHSLPAPLPFTLGLVKGERAIRGARRGF